MIFHLTNDFLLLLKVPAIQKRKTFVCGPLAGMRPLFAVDAEVLILSIKKQPLYK